MIYDISIAQKTVLTVDTSSIESVGAVRRLYVADSGGKHAFEITMKSGNKHIIEEDFFFPKPEASEDERKKYMDRARSKLVRVRHKIRNSWH